MIRIAAYLLAGIAVGLGIAWWQGMGQPDAGPESALSTAGRAPLEQRLSELETSLALERFERQALADELADLRLAFADVPALAAADDGGFRDAAAGRGTAVAPADGNGNPVSDRVRTRTDSVPPNEAEREQLRRQRQIDGFIAAGLTPERAQFILQREDELDMEVLQARYDATQSGATPEEVANISPAEAMRKELGDADYEKYLQGRGRPTTIDVRDVLTNSPAQVAGLQPGDEITAYNGRRVFEMGELTALTYAAPAGGVVTIEILRNGRPMQVYVQSGPIGISGGGRSTRRDVTAGGGR